MEFSPSLCVLLSNLFVKSLARYFNAEALRRGGPEKF